MRLPFLAPAAVYALLVAAPTWAMNYSDKDRESKNVIDRSDKNARSELHRLLIRLSSAINEVRFTNKRLKDEQEHCAPFLGAAFASHGEVADKLGTKDEPDVDFLTEDEGKVVTKAEACREKPPSLLQKKADELAERRKRIFSLYGPWNSELRQLAEPFHKAQQEAKISEVAAADPIWGDNHNYTRRPECSAMIQAAAWASFKFGVELHRLDLHLSQEETRLRLQAASLRCP